MSKKADDKKKNQGAGAKLPELVIDPDEEEHKKRDAYEMVQRAMIRSQIDTMLSTRENLVNQKEDIEAKMEEQSRDQSDIYDYLRDKLKKNFVSIADLEAQVSETHEDRLKREKELIATAKRLDEEREREKSQLVERLEAVEVELQSLKEFKENSATYEQKVKDLEVRLMGYKEAFCEEVTLLNSKSQEYRENGHKEKEEKMKAITKIAAEATQEQLNSRVRYMITQNKKMMEELRFQCLEVEKMERSHEGLLESSAFLLAKSASARHRVEELARRSRLLQRMMHHLQQKIQKRLNLSGKPCLQRQRCSTRGESVDEESSSEAGADERGTELSEKATTSPYTLAGMSKEKRQQLLDLRKELRREEVAIADAQAVVEKKRRALAERSRVSVLKADLARILASCLEDPLLGVNGGANVTPVNNFIQSDPSIKQPHDTSPTATFSSSSPLHHQHDAVTPNTTPSQIVSLDRHGHHEDDSARQDEQGDDAERETTMPLQLLPAIAGARQDDQAPAESGVKYDAFTDADGSKECKRGSWQRAAGMDADPQLWPETVPLPTTTRIDVVGGLGEEQRSVRGKGRTEARYLDAKMLKEALRLFLAKLQVPVELISPRTIRSHKASSLPALVRLPTADSVHSKVPQRGPRAQRKRRRIGAHGCGGYDSPVCRFSGMVGRASGDNSLRCRAARGAVAEDAVTSWSDRMTTGILSWDILEAAVRKTKRRSTRESACQTLTYRELRDHLASSAREQSDDSHTRASVSRRSVRANNPYYPASLATTVSDVSVCRSTQDDDTVGDVAIQGRGSSVRTVDWWGTAQPLGSRSPNGGKMADSVRFGGESGGSNGFGTRQRNKGDDRGGHAQDEVSVAHTRTIVERLRQVYDEDSDGKENAAFPSGATRHPRPLLCHSETTDSQGTSPPSHRAGQVCVSWEDIKSEEEPGVALEAAMGFEGAIANKRDKDSRDKSWANRPNEQEGQGAGKAHSKAEQRREEEEAVVDGSFCKSDVNEGDPDGNPCSSSLLPKGLDYRKVILFTVQDDGDRRFMRRQPGKLSAPATAAAAAGATYDDPVCISNGSLAAGGLAAERSDGCGEHLRTKIDSSMGQIHDLTRNEAVHKESTCMTATSASTVLLEPPSTMSRKREEDHPVTKSRGSCRQEGFQRGRGNGPFHRNRRSLGSEGYRR